MSDDREASRPADTGGGGDLPAGSSSAGRGVSQDRLRRLTEERRMVLLAQMGGELPPAWAADLADVDVQVSVGRLSPVDGDLRRWGLWFSFWRETGGGGVAPAAAGAVPEEDRREALELIMARAPVQVVMRNGRRVAVTSRSWAALVAITAHWRRVEELQREATLLTDLLARLYERRNRLPRLRLYRRRRITGLMARVDARIRPLLDELLYQRARLFAHALTPSGAPAAEGEFVPWWSEIAPEDDIQLIAALMEVGPGRLARLGPPPPRKHEPKGPTAVDEWGWPALLHGYEQRMGVPPGTLRNADLAQTGAWIRTMESAAAATDLDD